MMSSRFKKISAWLSDQPVNSYTFGSPYDMNDFAHYAMNRAGRITERTIMVGGVVTSVAATAMLPGASELTFLFGLAASKAIGVMGGLAAHAGSYEADRHINPDRNPMRQVDVYVYNKF